MTNINKNSSTTRELFEFLLEHRSIGIFKKERIIQISILLIFPLLFTICRIKIYAYQELGQRKIFIWSQIGLNIGSKITITYLEYTQNVYI